jgi:DNA-binding NarL/FixJ family response regulator
MKTTRILIVDDHSVVRRELRMLLANHQRWKICGEATTTEEALEKVRALKPGLVIMDLSMTGMNMPDAIRAIKNIFPDIGVLMLTMNETRQMHYAAIHAVAHASVLKSNSVSSLIGALEALAGKREFFRPCISKTPPESNVQPTSNNPSRKGSEIPDELTQRQLQVLNLLVRGQNNKQVASALGISHRTVESHRNQIMNRLNVQNLSELVLYAIRNSLLGT